MEDRRRQTRFLRERIKIRCVKLAIQPHPQADALPISVFESAMTYALDGVPPVCEHPNEVSADETIGSGYPHCQGRAL